MKPNKILSLSVPSHVFLFFILYSLFLSLYTGFKPFIGDTWQVISLSYNKSLIVSLKTIPHDFRLIEAIFYILEFKIIGLNGLIAHFISLFLHNAQVFLFGLVLYQWSNKHKLITILAMLFAFFNQPVSYSTYFVFKDNSRLAGIFFWSAILFFQKAFKNNKINVFNLTLAGLFNTLSFLSYENFSFLVFAAPLLLENYSNLTINKIKKRKKTYLLLLIYLIFFFFTNIIIRKFILDGGAVGFKKNKITYLVKSVIKYYYQSFQNFVYYPISEFKNIIKQNVWLLIPFLFITALTFILYKYLNTKSKRIKNYTFLVFLFTGSVITFLGIIPYILANYNPSDRTFSSFSFGLALLFSSIVYFFQNNKLQKLISLMLVLLIPISSLCHIYLSKNFRGTASFQKKNFTSLLKEIPNVKDNTNLLLAYKQAPEGFGVEGLKVLPKIIYSNPSLSAYFIYPANPRSSAEYYLKVNKTGLRPRGLPNIQPPLPLNNIVILENENEGFKLLNSISKENKDFLIEWDDDIMEFNTNSSLIKQDHLKNSFDNDYLKKL